MSALNHILAGFSSGFKHRHTLAGLLQRTDCDSHILNIPPARLKEEGVAALSLDFDGVLAHHGAASPLPEAIVWLEKCQTVFGNNRIFILSNKPTEERKNWFSEHFPHIRFISAVRKKPFPDGLNTIGELSGVPLSSILMVDDRLLTGCLAAINAGSRPCYIRRPFISLRHHPAAECFFMLLRITERAYIRVCALF